MDEQRALPHSLESERAVLGGLMLDSVGAGDLAEVLEPGDFYREAHGKLYELLLEMAEKGKPTEMVAVVDAVASTNRAEEMGGLSYISSLPDNVPSTENIEYYANIVRERAIVRRLLAGLTEVAERARAGTDELPELLDFAESTIFKVTQEKSSSDWQVISKVVDQEFMRIQQLSERSGEVTGMSTGFIDMDKMLAGLQRTDLIVLAARPAMGKCLSADSQIVCTDGSRRTIEELYQARSGELYTLDRSLKLTTQRPSDFIDDGIKPVFEVRTRLGRRVRTTMTHPYLTLGGWKSLGLLSVGARVAVPRRLPVFGNAAIGGHRAKLLGYLIGDGNLTNASPRFINGAERLRDDFCEAVAAFGGLSTATSSDDRTPTVTVSWDLERLAQRRADFGGRLRGVLRQTGTTMKALAATIGVTPGAVGHWVAGKTAPSPQRFSAICEALSVEPAVLGGTQPFQKNTPNPLTRWLDAIGVMGKDALSKVVPEVVFTAPRAEVALFLSRLFAADGWASVLASGQPQLGYASASEQLARDVQHLLLRFGIVSALRERSMKYQNGRRTAYQLNITDQQSIITFEQEIGIFGKEGAIAAAAAAARERGTHSSRDTIPVEIWDHIEAVKGEMSWAELSRRLVDAGHGGSLHPHRRGISRQRAAALGAVLEDTWLLSLSQNDVFWDEIVAIEPLGPQQVYDLTVPGTHNFIAEDVCVHNTALALCLGLNAAKTGAGVGMFSLEMSAGQLVTRLLCVEGRVDAGKVRTGFLSREHDWPNLTKAAESLYRMPIYIDDTPGLNITQLRSKARRLKSLCPDLGVLIIDYIGLMSGDGRVSRQEQIAQSSRGMKALAKELNVCILCLSQLNRAVEQRNPKIPQIADLRESGAIEQDADIIMFIYREEYYNKESPRQGEADVIIAKQRNGPTGTVTLHFEGRQTRFDNLAKNYSDDGYV